MTEEITLCELCEEPIDGEIVYLAQESDLLGAPSTFHTWCAEEAHGRGWKDAPITIGNMAKLLDRSENTLRRWVRDSERVFGLLGDLPTDQGLLEQDLWPSREEEGWKRLYWMPDQLAGMIEYSALKASRKGWHGSKKVS